MVPVHPGTCFLLALLGLGKVDPEISRKGDGIGILFKIQLGGTLAVPAIVVIPDRVPIPEHRVQNRL